MVWSGKGAASYDLVLKGKYPPAKLRSLPRIESTGRGRLCRIGATGKVRLTTPPMAPPLAGAFRARISLTHTEWQHFPFLGSRRTAALGVLHRRLRARSCLPIFSTPAAQICRMSVRYRAAQFAFSVPPHTSTFVYTLAGVPASTCRRTIVAICTPSDECRTPRAVHPPRFATAIFLSSISLSVLDSSCCS